MIASSSEEAWGFDAEVSDPLLVVVHDAETVLLEDSLILFFDFLQCSVQKYENAMRRFYDVFRVGRVCMNAGLPVFPLLTSVS